MSDFDIKLCLANGERLARLEAGQVYQTSLIEGMSKCENCQNAADLAKMKFNMRLINWLGSVVGGATIAAAIGRLIE